MSGSFFLFSLLFISAYGVQGALQAGYIRKYDALTVGMYRNVSLIVTMVPLLYFVPTSELWAVTKHLDTLALASLVGAIGLWMSFASAHYLPIGVGTALRHMTHAIGAVMLGAFLFQEFLEPFQLLFLGLTVASGIALILSKVDYGHLNPKMVSRGLALTLGAGLVVALSFFLFSALSRESHPLAVAYFWEAGVGLYLVAFFLLRAYKTRSPELPTQKDAFAIVGISLLTILGTSGYAFAVDSGPYALASGLMSLTTLVAVVLGRYLYHERLSRFQVFLVLLAVLFTICLKIAS